MIIRHRILGKIAGSPRRNWLIEAGAGFGKSVLLDQVRSVIVDSLVLVRPSTLRNDCAGFLVELAAGAQRSGNPETAKALSLIGPHPGAVVEVLADGGKSLAVDDLHLWDESVASFILELEQEARERMSIFLSARRLPAGLVPLRTNPNWNRLTTADVAMTPTEVAEVLAGRSVNDTDIAASLFSLSQGWPLAVATVAARMEGTNEPIRILQELGRHDSLVDGLLRSYLSDLDQRDIDTASALAALPFFDGAIAETVGSLGVIDRLAAAGIPITFRPDGWAEIADQFRSSLATAGSSNTPKIGADVIEIFLHWGEIHTAINTYLRSGQREQAAEVLASLALEQEYRLDPELLNVTMLELGEIATLHPRCLYVHSHVCAMYGMNTEGIASLERCIDAFTERDPGRAERGHVEALASLGIWRAFGGDFVEARRLLRLCEAAIEISNPDLSLQANLHDLRGVIAYTSGTESELDLAVAELTAALDIWRRLQEPLAAASTVFRLVGGALVRRGLRKQALEVLDALPGFGPMTLLHSARIHLERSFILPYLGRAGDVPAELIEPRRIARILGHEWIAERALVAEIVAAGIAADGDRVTELCKEVERHGYLVADAAPEGFRWGEISEALARCDLFDEAASALQRIHAIRGLPRWYVLYTELTITARCGAPEAGLRLLDELRLHDDVETSMLWNLDLLEAYCHWRMDDHSASAKALDQAYLEAELLGEPSQPTIVENSLVARMKAERTATSIGSVEITMFGGFRVSVDGQQIKVPKGQASSLIKVLVLGGGRLVVDQIIDPLWPDADTELGRRRLRNVLKRVREACGDIIVRTEAGLRLRSNVSSDYLRAVVALDAADLAGASIGQITHAIRLADLDLLPDDRYEDWAQKAREHLFSRLTILLGIAADQSSASGDVDSAIASLVRAHELDEYGQGYAQRATDLLEQCGRAASAAALAERLSLGRS